MTDRGETKIAGDKWVKSAAQSEILRSLEAAQKQMGVGAQKQMGVGAQKRSPPETEFDAKTTVGKQSSGPSSKISRMIPYDSDCVPSPFPLQNTGCICHFNSLLQALVSCSAFTKCVLDNEEYASKTNTGKALHAFISTALSSDRKGIEQMSSQVLFALMGDLKSRRPDTKFGSSQESASEGLILLLDMIEPSEEKAHPVTELFMHRYRCRIYCTECRKIVSEDTTDLAVQLRMFHIDAMKTQLKTSKEFSSAVRRYKDVVTNYACGKCKRKVQAVRAYTLLMVPEIIACIFNVYSVRKAKYLPARLSFQGKTDGEYLWYEHVADVEQTGGLHGGHYTARGRRNNGTLYSFNDSATPYPVTFSERDTNLNKYLVFYHYTGSGPESGPKLESGPKSKLESAPTKKT